MHIPRVIYKYRDWTIVNHRRMITHNEVFLSSPRDFNDPFDCKISTHFLSLDSTEKVEEYINERKKSSELDEIGINILRDRLNKIKDYWQMFEAVEFTSIDQNYGVLSLSNRWDSILMWSHYSNNHTGFCVGFNEEKMRESGIFGTGGSVIYTDNFPLINPLENDEKAMILQTLHKASDWKYEEEYRLLKLFFPKAPTLNDRKIILGDDYIEEVNLGFMMNKEDRTELSKICKLKNIKVYQLHKVPYKFQFERELI